MGLCTEGNLRFKIDWASLIVGGKFTVFALFYFVFEGKFRVQAPWGAYIRRGDLTEGLLRYDFGRLIFRGAYTCWSLFLEFYGMFLRVSHLNRVSFLPVLTLHFWCDPYKIQVHKCLATQETNHLLKFSDLIKVCMSHH